MFKALSALFSKSGEEIDTKVISNELAVAALLVHLARVDGEFSKREKKAIAAVLEQHFDLDHAQTDELMTRAKEKDAEAVDLYQFTSVLTKLDMDQRINIISMMWSITFADDENHELEDNLVWRVAELIGVSARDRTRLRAQFRADLNDRTP